MTSGHVRQEFQNAFQIFGTVTTSMIAMTILMKMHVSLYEKVIWTNIGPESKILIIFRNSMMEERWLANGGIG